MSNEKHREMWIKNIKRYHLKSVRTLRSNKCWHGGGEKEALVTLLVGR